MFSCCFTTRCGLRKGLEPWFSNFNVIQGTWAIWLKYKFGFSQTPGRHSECQRSVSGTWPCCTLESPGGLQKLPMLGLHCIHHASVALGWGTGTGTGSPGYPHMQPESEEAISFRGSLKLYLMLLPEMCSNWAEIEQCCGRGQDTGSWPPGLESPFPCILAVWP